MGRLHAAAIFLGAFLLFQVQPLLTKWILPWYGGGPDVWTTCALFFQAALFAGYAYAHGIARRPGAVHLALIAAALVTLPPAPGERWKPAGPGHPVGPILLLLAANVGLPFLLLSSTGPLVQAWFARTYPARSPYRLYALSNAGSLAALLTYPLIVEPRLGLRMQSTVWTWAFGALAVLHAAAAIAVPRAAPAAEGEEAAPPTVRRRVAWVVLPAFASAMLLATTSQITQDVAVVPFLWVLPLAVYLVSFIVAFDYPAAYRPEFLAPATVVLSLAAALVYYLQPHGTAGMLAGVGITLAVLFCLSLLCHGEAAALKPEPRRLTGYYLSLAGGGALGGLFAGLIAPRIFSTLFEWKLGLGITTLAAGVGTAWAWRGFLRAHLNLAAALGVIVLVGFALQAGLLAHYRDVVESSRNFYGVVAVERRDGGLDLVHGRVLHGRQLVDEPRRRKPLTYYVEGSGLGRVLDFFRERPDLRVGGVGLGSGTIAAYVRHPSQELRFYEINPEMERIARLHFTYLKDCPGRVEVVLGDGRLSLEREAPQGFHVLALDAFSGHSVPVHLLTAEAMKSYARHLAPDGAVAIHVSNHVLDLAPVARGAARANGLAAVRVDYRPVEKEEASASSWVICTRNEALLQTLRAHASTAAERPEATWTDDASDLFSILRAR
jgi:hypothetical protein